MLFSDFGMDLLTPLGQKANSVNQLTRFHWRQGTHLWLLVSPWRELPVDIQQMTWNHGLQGSTFQQSMNPKNAFAVRRTPCGPSFTRHRSKMGGRLARSLLFTTLPGLGGP
jgi:hypothetical protein